MKTDKELLANLTAFAVRFISYNIFSYRDGGYMNGLGDFDIGVKDWDNSEDLRKEFESWLVDNDLFLSKNYLHVDFDPVKLKIFGLIKELG